MHKFLYHQYLNTNHLAILAACTQSKSLQKTIAFSGLYLIVVPQSRKLQDQAWHLYVITINNRIKVGIPVFSRIGLAFLLADPKGWVIAFKKL
jgi:hypothetical protein